MKGTLAALLVLGLTPLVAPAVTVTWSIMFMTTWDMTDTDGDLGVALDRGPELWQVGHTLTPRAGYDYVNYVNQFALYAQVSGLPSGEAVAVLSADINVGQTLYGGSPPTVAWNHNVPMNARGLEGFNGYEPNFMFSSEWDRARSAKGINKSTGSVVWSATTDRIICPDTGELMSIPGDKGPSSEDLNGLLADIDVYGSIQRHVAVAEPLLFGSVYLKWDGTKGAQISVGACQTPGITWAVYTDIVGGSTGMNTGGAYVTGAPGTYALTVPTTRNYAPGDYDEQGMALTLVPEPATMAMLVLGGMALLARRRNA